MPAPVLEFAFNEPDKVLQSTGALSSPVQILSGHGDYLEVFGQPGEGASQKAGDYCVRSILGDDGRGSLVLGAKLDCLNGAKTLTVTFWMRMESAKEGTACIFRQRAGGNPEGLIITVKEDLSIACLVNDVMISSRPFSYESAINEWTFVAIVFDAVDLKKLIFYGGTADVSVEERLNMNFDGEIKSTDAVWSLLAASDGTDPLRGKIDNFRVYDTALDQSQIEEVRKLDVLK